MTLYHEMQDSSIISLTSIQYPKSLIYQSLFASVSSQVVLVFGQMNETPGNRMRVTHASLNSFSDSCKLGQKSQHY